MFRPLGTVSPLDGSIGYLAFALSDVLPGMENAIPFWFLLQTCGRPEPAPITLQHTQETLANTGP